MNSKIKCCKKCGGVDLLKNGKCKPCVSAYMIEWRRANSENIKQYRIDNAEKLKAQELAWSIANRDKCQARRDEKKKTCPDVAKQASADHYRKNAEKMKARSSLFYRENKDHCLARQKIWVKNNPEKMKAIRARQREVDRLNPLNKIKDSIGQRVRVALARGGYTKTSRTQEILGCDWNFFKSHIERQFLNGMSWEKMGSDIHIDHIVPLATAETEEDVMALNHFTNLRPLWAIDNLRKNDSITHLI